MRRTPWKLFAAYLFVIFGAVFLFVVGNVVVLAFAPGFWLLYAGAMTVFYCVVAFFTRITFLARRMAARSRNVGPESPLNDSRPDVLYLRSFDADAFRPGLGLRFTSEEEDLATAVRPLGDLIAIGRPGESIPLPGAARLYCTQDEWQNSVCQRMSVAPLVIIRAGLGDGLLWECEQAFRMLSAHQAVILVLNIRADEYNQFAAAIQSRLGVVLPAIPRLSVLGVLSGFGNLGKVKPGFVSFSEGWYGQFLPIRGAFGHRKLIKGFRRALRPVFAAHRESGR